MSRRLIILALVTVAEGAAHAEIAVDPAPPEPAPAEPAAPEAAASEPALQTSSAAPADMSDQAIGASIGVVAGGRSTPGGLRIAGHYLYQLSDQDWFDGTAAFTFGGGDAACFRDRMNTFLCDHSLADGNELEVAATVRRFLGGKGDFWPFLHAGVGIALARFGDDGVTGFAVPLHAGGGLRASVAPTVAVTAHADLDLGFGLFNHSLGLEPQFGVTIAAGAEFKL